VLIHSVGLHDLAALFFVSISTEDIADVVELRCAKQDVGLIRRDVAVTSRQQRRNSRDKLADMAWPVIGQIAAIEAIRGRRDLIVKRLEI
jgi:hypothetical protein